MSWCSLGIHDWITERTDIAYYKLGDGAIDPAVYYSDKICSKCGKKNYKLTRWESDGIAHNIDRAIVIGVIVIVLAGAAFLYSVGYGLW